MSRAKRTSADTHVGFHAITSCQTEKKRQRERQTGIQAGRQTGMQAKKKTNNNQTSETKQSKREKANFQKRRVKMNNRKHIIAAR